MTFPPWATRWLREPLVHFLLIGAVVYAVLSLRPPDPGERRIVVDEAVVGPLVERWTQAFRRAPSQAEIDGLIRDYVKDEVYYREALRLGLDQGDESLRRLMRNKMIATATSDAEATTPGDAELQALLDKEPARYAAETRHDFVQIYLGSDSPASRTGAKRLAEELNRGANPDGRGLPSPLPARFVAAESSEVAGRFGDGFAAGLNGLPLKQWSALPSGLGLHLVQIERRSAATKPRLAEVRQRLENDWRAAALSAAEDKQYRELLQGYDVVTKLSQ